MTKHRVERKTSPKQDKFKSKTNETTRTNQLSTVKYKKKKYTLDDFVRGDLTYVYHLSPKSRRNDIRREGLKCGKLRSLDFDPSNPTGTNTELSFFVEKPLWVKYNETKKEPGRTDCYRRHLGTFVESNDITYGLLGSEQPGYPDGCLEIDLWRVEIDKLPRDCPMKWKMNSPYDPKRVFETDYDDDTVVFTTHRDIPREAITLHRKSVFPASARSWFNAIPDRFEMHLIAK